MDKARRAVHDIERMSRQGLDWVTFATEATEAIRKVVPFDRCCWHAVDPGTMLFTGSVNRNIECSGSWLAEHEYVLDNVNKWWFLARSGRLAGATSIATHGDLSRNLRSRSHADYGIGDELRGSFVANDRYWGAAGLLRESDQPWFTEADVGFLASLSKPLAEGFRTALIANVVTTNEVVADTEGPGVVVFDEAGQPEFISPAAEHWIAQLVEEPPPTAPAESKMVQAVAARARTLSSGEDPLKLAPRSRVQTRTGAWILLYGTPLTGGSGRRTAVVLQPARPNEVAPLIALAYGLTERETQIVQLCMQGRSTKEMARVLYVAAYTIQDHLKSIFDKTGVRSRNELVGQIFLEHYVSRWEDADSPTGWTALSSQASTSPPRP